MNALTLLFFFPLMAAGLMLVLPTLSLRTFKRVAILFSLAPLALLVAKHTELLGLSINKPWFPAIGIQFHLF